MGVIVPEYEVHATKASIDPGRGRFAITLQTDQGPVVLYAAVDVLILLKEGIEKKLAEARRGGSRDQD